MNRPKIKNTSFDNFAGIAQVAGELGKFNWFFHARSGTWRFHLVESSDRPAAAVQPDEDDYWIEGTYRTSRQLTNDQVSSLVSDCIDRYWRDRGQQIYHRRVGTVG